MRDIPESMDAATVASIDRRLDGMEASEGVTIGATSSATSLTVADEPGSIAEVEPRSLTHVVNDRECRFGVVSSAAGWLSNRQGRKVP
jgi:hypothetical protein